MSNFTSTTIFIIIIVVLATFSLCKVSEGQEVCSVTFMWQFETPTPDLDKFELWEAVTSGGYDFNGQPIAEASKDLRTLTIQTPLGSAKYYVLTAIDTSGNRSGPSNEVFGSSDQVPPDSATMLSVQIQCPQP